MIVKVAGWLYVIEAGLCLLSLAGLPSYMHYGRLGPLLVGLTIGAIGVGLLKRLTWARWLALGTSFIGWTLGTLMLLASIGLIVFAIASAGSLFSAATASVLGMVMVLVFLLMFALLVLGIVVNYKLFMHLISEDGKHEFEAPEGSSALTVLASSVAWVAIVLVSANMAPGRGVVDALVLHHQLSGSRSSQDTGSAQRADTERTAALRRDEARFEAARAEERLRAEEEAALAEAERNAAYDDRIRAVEQAEQERAPASTGGGEAESQSSGEAEKSTNKILKCQDPAGAVSYTQGYCPAGTKEVAAPRFE